MCVIDVHIHDPDNDHGLALSGDTHSTGTILLQTFHCILDPETMQQCGIRRNHRVVPTVQLLHVKECID